MEYTKFTEEEFKERTGYLLTEKVPDDQDEGTKVDRFITNVCEQITDYIIDNSPSTDIDDISVAQNTIINQAAMIQAEWILENTDYSTQSGLNAVTGVDISDKIRKLEISPRAKRLLNARIIYRGF